MLTKAVALDFADHGIRANAVCPAFVDTPLNVPHYTRLGGRQALEDALPDWQPIGGPIEPVEIGQSVAFQPGAGSALTERNVNRTTELGIPQLSGDPRISERKIAATQRQELRRSHSAENKRRGIWVRNSAGDDIDGASSIPDLPRNKASRAGGPSGGVRDLEEASVVG